MAPHYVVERGVAFEAHTQLKINDGVTWEKCLLINLELKCKKWSRYGYKKKYLSLSQKIIASYKKNLFRQKSWLFRIVFWKHQLFTHIIDFRNKKGGFVASRGWWSFWGCTFQRFLRGLSTKIFLHFFLF